MGKIVFFNLIGEGEMIFSHLFDKGMPFYHMIFLNLHIIL